MMTLDILDLGEDHLLLMEETIIIIHLQDLCLVLHLMDMDSKDLEDMEVMDMGVDMTEILTAIILDTGTQEGTRGRDMKINIEIETVVIIMKLSSQSKKSKLRNKTLRQ